LKNGEFDQLFSSGAFRARLLRLTRDCHGIARSLQSARGWSAIKRGDAVRLDPSSMGGTGLKPCWDSYVEGWFSTSPLEIEEMGGPRHCAKQALIEAPYLGIS
jgi:hypothetical protein